MQGVGAVDAARAPGQIGVDTLARTNFDAYMSPYTQNVINRSLETLGGAQEQALNKLGAQATAARAFGGSRQGVAEAGTREAYGKQAADLVAGLQEKAFTQALGSGQFDIGNVQQARALQSGQQMTAETLGQQAREAAAARDQAARAGNMAAANQFAMQQAQFAAGSKRGSTTKVSFKLPAFSRRRQTQWAASPASACSRRWPASTRRWRRASRRERLSRLSCKLITQCSKSSRRIRCRSLTRSWRRDLVFRRASGPSQVAIRLAG